MAMSHARFTCCHDEDVPYGRADDFNRCCYNRFAGGRDWINGQDDVDDPCCDRITANIFWRHPGRIAELCLPNINIDYSNLEIDVKLRDGTEKSIELKELVALRYDCPYLHKRSNFYRYDI
ncbi:unnamed protein product [Soboliphyme baturini]|uniref:Uncharacterized protein n=1 Tax=Soboliphyme baturini TaxID=241478 RepID=A0A183IKJ3_9BILA|nr:unnamed protein product [Soboliphyme baturini]